MSWRLRNRGYGLGNDADGCPLGLYRRTGRNDPRDPCIPDPNYRPAPPMVFTCSPPAEIVALGPCAAGYTRDQCTGLCSPDPNWRAPQGTEGQYVNVGGTLIPRDSLGMPAAAAGMPDLFGGMDTNTLLLIGGGLLFLVVVMGGKRR